MVDNQWAGLLLSSIKLNHCMYVCNMCLYRATGKYKYIPAGEAQLLELQVDSIGLVTTSALGMG